MKTLHTEPGVGCRLNDCSLTAVQMFQPHFQLTRLSSPRMASCIKVTHTFEGRSLRYVPMDTRRRTSVFITLPRPSRGGSDSAMACDLGCHLLGLEVCDWSLRLVQYPIRMRAARRGFSLHEAVEG